MALPEKIYFVTGNANKWLEVKDILGPHLNNVLQQATIDLPELQGTIEEIAILKCKHAAKELNAAVITEDTALVFDDMNGMPGPYVKWFLEALKVDGLSLMARSYSKALNNKVVSPKAKAICTMTYCQSPNEEPLTFQGVTDGHISEPRGSLKFGWDPIFIPDGSKLTYAEMAKEDKNIISHRYKALAMLINHLNQ